MTDTLEKETFSFQTEVGQLLEIVAGSLYSNREVFLRELVSNASDACDKRRYAGLTDAALAPSEDFEITLDVDGKAKTLSISDNGIGMNHADLLATLGTIAKSGTSAFIEALKAEDKDKPGLIGQFGVGFYSAFMVASQVDVLTRKAGEDEAWLWSSDGKGPILQLRPPNGRQPARRSPCTSRKTPRNLPKRRASATSSRPIPSISASPSNWATTP